MRTLARFNPQAMIMELIIGGHVVVQRLINNDSVPPTMDRKPVIF
jgi:hypothetical protein